MHCYNYTGFYIIILLLCFPVEPGIVQDVISFQLICENSSICLVNTLWHPPVNIATSNVNQYKIYWYVDGSLQPIRTFNIIDEGIGMRSVLFEDPSCRAHTISVSAVNDCVEGHRSPERMINAEDIITLPNSICDLVKVNTGATTTNKGKL